MTLCSTVYEYILKDNVQQSARDLELKRTRVIQQDNQEHTSASTSQWLKNQNEGSGKAEWKGRLLKHLRLCDVILKGQFLLKNPPMWLSFNTSEWAEIPPH